MADVDGDKSTVRVYNQEPDMRTVRPRRFPMATSTRKTRFSFVLFVLYLLLYGGFVFLAAFAPDAMEMTPLAGVNLAIWYGFGLIFAAVLVALIYGWASGNRQQGIRDLDDDNRSEP